MGEGHRDALVGVTGMFCGALTYIFLFPGLRSAVETLPRWGKVTIAQVTSTSPWLWIGLLAAVALLGALFLEGNLAPRLSRTIRAVGRGAARGTR